MNCRRSVIIAELWWPEMTRLGKKFPIFAFLKNDSLLENRKIFITTPIDVVMFKLSEI